MYLSSVSSRLLLHDLNTWELKKSYGCYDGILRHISWSDDSKYILQVNSKGLVEILSAADHDVRSLQHVPLKDTWSASFHREGHRNVAIGTRSGNVMIWDTKNKTITKTFPTPTQQSSVNHVSYNAKNTSLAATMHNGDTVIYGLVSNIPVATIKLAFSRSISAMKFHHETRSLLGLATDEGHICLRDITTSNDKAFFESVHAAPISDFAYSLVNRDVMLSCGFDKVMHLYDVRLQNVVSTVRTPHTLTSVTINQDNLVALGTNSGKILIYDLRDLNEPMKILQGHDEEVRKVAFQPVRRKSYSTEVSLRDELEVNPPIPKIKTPTCNKSPDVYSYYVTDTSNGTNIDMSAHGEPRADSFLVMMGLDKSNNVLDLDKSGAYEAKSDQPDRFLHVDTEKNISKVSTPMNNRTAENFNNFPSPIFPLNVNGVHDARKSEHEVPNGNHSGGSGNHSETMEELKDFVKLTLADVADDNRNYFLHIMMALTKQKLFMEKQIGGMNEQIRSLIQNQTTLVETNRKLAQEIDNLKANKHYFRIIN